MNETIQKIMLFINDHTLLLIGICVFLILVLIGYLIDNSVKSKRIRKDIKNPAQVPEDIKDQIIKQAENNVIKKEDTTPKLEIDSNPKDLDTALNLNYINSQQEPTINIETNVVNNEQTSQPESNNIIENNFVMPSNENQPNMEVPLNLDLSMNNIGSENTTYVDPDANIMNPIENNNYTNDKKLSEILFDMNNIEEPSNNNIFNDNNPEIVINNDVKKDDVQIQNNDNSSDELDRIMRKLSTMNNNIEDDNYTNIF